MTLTSAGAVVAAVLAGGCGRPAEDGTAAMAARLAALAAEQERAVSPYLPATLLADLDALRPPTDLRARLDFDARRVLALLAAGRNEEAGLLVGEMLARVPVAGGTIPLRQQVALHELAGLAALRVAEQRNCVGELDPDTCLLPLAGGGVHRVATPAREALAALVQALELAEQAAARGEPLPPQRLIITRWLANLAAQAAGASVGGASAALPPRFALPSDAFVAGRQLPRFPDVAARAGVAVLGMSGGVVVEDLDGDLLLDLMVSAWGLREPLRFFHNRGDGTFEQRPAGLEGITGGLNLVHADYDNDGDADVLVLRGGWMGRYGRQPNSLLRNDGQGQFRDVTAAAGLLDERPTQTAAWADYDGDGWLDLFVGNESTAGELHPCQLFRSRGDGSFEEVAARVGAQVVGYVKGVAFGDVDDDGRPDLYVSRLGQPNVLLRNEGPVASGGWRFRDITAVAGVAAPRFGFPTWFFDADNDGDLDLYASAFLPDALSGELGAAYAEFFAAPGDAEANPHFYRNLGGGRFRDDTEAVGLDRALLAMGANVGDVDNDGYPDLFLGTGAPDLRALMPNRLFTNEGGERFVDATWSANLGHLQKGHGAAFGDLDNDGDLDLYHVLGGAYPGDAFRNALYRNPGGMGRSLVLLLEGVRSNRSAIGARVTVELATPGGMRTVRAMVSTGGSFGSSSLRQVVGVGDASRVLAVRIDWPSGEHQVLTGLPLGAVARVVEGRPAELLTLPRFELGG